MRIAAQILRRKSRIPPCHEETMKVITGLNESKYKLTPKVYKLVLECDDCLEKARLEKRRRKASPLYFLGKYLKDRNKNDF